MKPVEVWTKICIHVSWLPVYFIVLWKFGRIQISSRIPQLQHNTKYYCFSNLMGVWYSTHENVLEDGKVSTIVHTAHPKAERVCILEMTSWHTIKRQAYAECCSPRKLCSAPTRRWFYMFCSAWDMYSAGACYSFYCFVTVTNSGGKK